MTDKIKWVIVEDVLNNRFYKRTYDWKENSVK